MAKLVTWTQYQQTIGDRSSLFEALADRWPVERALYLGSYVDLSPSTAIPSVTYVDTDARAARFFSDPDLVQAELAGRTRPGTGADVTFVALDYNSPLPVPDGSMDLVVSLFAGPTWDGCRRYLRPGGYLFANASHGEASLAALDPSLTLVATAHEEADGYRLDTEALSDYLIPKRPADAEKIRRSGRGVTYTRDAFAYLFALRETAPRASAPARA